MTDKDFVKVLEGKLEKVTKENTLLTKENTILLGIVKSYDKGLTTSYGGKN